MKLRINASDKSADTYGNKFIIPLDIEMLDSSYHITKQDLETDYVMILCSVITTELSNLQQHPQMLSMRSKTYP